MFRKKLKNILVYTALLIAAAEISAVLSNNLFFEKIATKEVLKRSMPKSTANAVKHAYAASIIYSTFRTFFFTENAAKNITIFLGKTNEIAEVIFKPHQDSTLEMMKDLGNNLLGICAGKLIEENRDNPAMDDRISVIGHLAERKELFLSREDIILDEVFKEESRKSSSYFVAVKWLKENEDKISCNFTLNE